MSRSYMKHPHKKAGKDSSYKKIFNRMLRRNFNPEKEDSFYFFKNNNYKKKKNSYLINDFIASTSWKDFQEWEWVQRTNWTLSDKYSYWKKYYQSK